MAGPPRSAAPRRCWKPATATSPGTPTASGARPTTPACPGTRDPTRTAAPRRPTRSQLRQQELRRRLRRVPGLEAGLVRRRGGHLTQRLRRHRRGRRDHRHASRQAGAGGQGARARRRDQRGQRAVAGADYQHQEIEGSGAVATTFRNRGSGLRLQAEHRSLRLGSGRLQGVFGLQTEGLDFSALGDEAFVPSTTSRHLALFALEAYELGGIRVVFGARAAHARIDSEGDGPGQLQFVPPPSRSFTPFGTALGGAAGQQVPTPEGPVPVYCLHRRASAHVRIRARRQLAAAGGCAATRPGRQPRLDGPHRGQRRGGAGPRACRRPVDARLHARQTAGQLSHPHERRRGPGLPGADNRA